MTIVNLEEPYVLQLRKPVALGEVSWSTLTLREPTAEEVEKASNISNPATSNIILISVVADIPVAAVKKIGSRDFNRAVAYLENFM